MRRTLPKQFETTNNPNTRSCASSSTDGRQSTQVNLVVAFDQSGRLLSGKTAELSANRAHFVKNKTQSIVDEGVDVTICHTGGIIETSIGSAGAHSIDGSRTKKIPILEP